MPRLVQRTTEKSCFSNCSPLRLAMDCKMSPRFSLDSCFRVIDLEGNIAARFADKPLTKMPCSNKFSFATSDYLTAGRLIYQLCRGANRGNAEQNRKGYRRKSGTKDDIASLKNWAG